MQNNEPGATTNIVVGGVSLALLIGPLNDLLLEMGASPRLSTALVGILMWAATFGAALWARRKTVSTKTAAAQAAVALSLPADANRTELNTALVKENLPPVDAAPAFQEKIPEEDKSNVTKFNVRR